MKTHHYVQSEMCNLKCTYCNVDTKNKHKHSFDDFLDYYSNYVQPANEEYQFDIFGGEPFMILEEHLVLQIVEFLEKDDNCKAIRITTNGSYFSELILQIICKPKVEITISFDGIFQEQNRIGYYSRQLDTTKRLIGFLVANKRYFKIHSMLTGSMFDVVSVPVGSPRIPFSDKYNLLINQYQYIQQVLKVSEDVCKIDFEIVRDIGTWDLIQIRRFLESFDRYSTFLTDKIKQNKFKSFDDVDSLFTQYVSAFIEAVQNSNYQRPTCGVDTGKHTSFFQNRVIPCERFARTPEDLDTLNNPSKMKKIFDNCESCSIREMCNRGCIYEHVKNKGLLHELCIIYKGMFTTVQKHMLYDQEHTILKLFHGDKNGK